MMKTLYELCKPRQDVFDDRHQDDALDLANLTDGSIDADLFFEGGWKIINVRNTAQLCNSVNGQVAGAK